MGKSRFCALLAALALAAALAAPALAADTEAWLVPKARDYPGFADVDGTWCGEAVETVCEAGLMEGLSADCFAPDGTLTHAQVVAVASRLLDLLTGGDGDLPPQAGDAWYQGYYEAIWAALAGREVWYPSFLHPDDMAQEVNTPCDRESFVLVLSYALLCAEVTLPERNRIDTLPDVLLDDGFGGTSGAVFSFYRAGILNGSDPYGTFHAYESLTRGQAAAMLARLVDPGQRLTFSLQVFDLCRNVLGLEPEATALTVDGAPVQAQYIALSFAGMLDLCVRGGFDLTGALDRARDDARRSEAVIRLAAQKGVTVSNEELYLRGIQAGYRGITAAAQWEDRRLTALSRKLRAAYHGGVLPDSAHLGYVPDEGDLAMEADLDAVMASLPAELSPALEGLDLKAVYARLAASPFFADRMPQA